MSNYNRETAKAGGHRLFEKKKNKFVVKLYEKSVYYILHKTLHLELEYGI